MRTTLSIDDDVLAAIRHLAERRRQTVGEVLTELARQGLAPAGRRRGTRNGLPLLPRGAGSKAVSLALVNELRDDVA
jgi:hypothetical protein